MPRGRKPKPLDKPLRSEPLSPTISPEARENQLIAMAYDLAEQRMMDGTASAQEVTHFLKLGSSKDRLEREILTEQKKLVSAKTQSYASVQNTEELIKKALEAWKSYTSVGDEDE